MNIYSEHNVRHFHSCYEQRTFDQDDVALFLVLTRDYAKKGSIFRELGDFLAHPDAKNKGLVLECITAVSAHFEEYFDRCIYDPNYNPPIFNGMGTLSELQTDIQEIFKMAVANATTIKISDDNFREFVFCVICILGACKVKCGTRIFPLEVEYSHSFSLRVRIESVTHPSFFAEIPLLQLSNVWISCPTAKKVLNRHIARRFKNKILAAIAYEDDKINIDLSASTFNVGQIWPLTQLSV